MNIESKKRQIVSQIMKIGDEQFINQLEKIIQKYEAAHSAVAYLAKPMRQKLVLTELIAEQSYKGADKKKLDSLIEAAAIEEPLKNLLELL